jgi:hypothetical protein
MIGMTTKTFFVSDLVAVTAELGHLGRFHRVVCAVTPIGSRTVKPRYASRSCTEIGSVGLIDEGRREWERTEGKALAALSP